MEDQQASSAPDDDLPQTLREVVRQAWEEVNVCLVFPWASSLPSEELAQFTADLAEKAGDAAETGNYVPFNAVLRTWHAAARMHDDLAVFKGLTRPSKQARLSGLLNGSAVPGNQEG